LPTQPTTCPTVTTRPGTVRTGAPGKQADFNRAVHKGASDTDPLRR
jgi:hypothetical protein